MADKKISQLTTKAVPATSDNTIIVDSVGTTDKKVTLGSLPMSDYQTDAVNAKIANTGDLMTGAYTITGTTAPNLLIQNTATDGLSGVFIKDDTENYQATVAVVNSANNTNAPLINPKDLMFYNIAGAVVFAPAASKGFKLFLSGTQTTSVISGTLTSSSIDAAPLMLSNLTTKSTPAVDDTMLIRDVSGGANKKAKLEALPISSAISTRLTNTACSLQAAYAPATVTGTSAETILRTITIPANTLSSSDIINFKTLIFTKTGTAANYTIKIKTNTSNTLTGATTIATNVASTANVAWMSMQRKYLVDSSLLYGYPFATTAITDVISSPTTWSSTAFDVAVTNYIFVTVQLASTADSVSNIAIQVDKE